MSTTDNIIVKGLVSWLCGYGCGTAVDAIIEYLKQPDCSNHHRKRLLIELQKMIVSREAPHKGN